MKARHEVARAFADIRGPIESTSLDEEISADLMRACITLARSLHHTLNSNEPLPVTGEEIDALDRWFTANGLPTISGPRSTAPTDADRALLDQLYAEGLVHAPREDPRHPTIPRHALVEFMRANWQDPAGFHEAVAGALGIDEAEYAPTRRYEWSGFVVVEGDLTPEEAEEQAAEALAAINKGESVRVFRDDSEPTVEAGS